MKIIVVGAGGIGTHLLGPLCRYLDNTEDKPHILVLDGDQYELKNADRQTFSRIGNKAEVSVEQMRNMFPRLNIEAKPTYLTDDNACVYIGEGDIVLACVDNHATRLLLSSHCATLSDAVLISGGNDYSIGSVHTYIREKGKDKTPPLTFLHPEIASPRDKSPDQMSCEELASAGVPQLIFANLSAAACMLSTFWLVRKQKDLPYTEVFFNLESGASRSVDRRRL
jgi:molybdopterin/thiamine biosynthesis adenylyltransferase